MVGFLGKILFMKPGKFVVKRKFCFLLLLLLFRKFSVLLVVGRGQKTIVALSHPVHPLSRLSLSSPSFGFLWKQTRMEGQFVMFTSVDTMEWYISEDPPSLLRWVVSENELPQCLLPDGHITGGERVWLPHHCPRFCRLWHNSRRHRFADFKVPFPFIHNKTKSASSIVHVWPE